MLMRHWKGMAAVGFVCLGVGGAAVYATVPGADGQIHGCHQVNNGQLRVIDTDAGQTCRPAELAIQWRAGTTMACPIGTAPVVNVCIEVEARSFANLPDAAGDCADEGRRLPSGGELMTFRVQPGITLAPTPEWTDDMGDTEAGDFRFVVVAENGIFVREVFDPGPYRCVAGPIIS